MLCLDDVTISPFIYFNALVSILKNLINDAPKIAASFVVKAAVEEQSLQLFRFFIQLHSAGFHSDFETLAELNDDTGKAK